MSGGGEKTQTVTQRQDTAPWSGQVPYLTQGMQFSSDLLAKGLLTPQAYSGQRVAPFGQDTNAGLGMLRQRARTGSPVMQTGNTLATDTLQGDYLNGNPYLDSMYDRAASAVTRNFREGTAPGIDSAAINAGRYGSNAWGNLRDSANDQLGRSLEGLATNMYGGNYDQERTRQMATLGLAPSLANQDYVDAQRLMGAGTLTEGKQQQQLDANRQYYDEFYNRPFTDASRFMGLINGNYGQSGTSSSQQPMYGGNTAMNMLGGGLAGAGLGSALGLSNPWTAGLAAGGALFGLL